MKLFEKWTQLMEAKSRTIYYLHPQGETYDETWDEGSISFKQIALKARVRTLSKAEVEKSPIGELTQLDAIVIITTNQLERAGIAAIEPNGILLIPDSPNVLNRYKIENIQPVYIESQLVGWRLDVKKEV